MFHCQDGWWCKQSYLWVQRDSSRNSSAKESIESSDSAAAAASVVVPVQEQLKTVEAKDVRGHRGGHAGCAAGRGAGSRGVCTQAKTRTVDNGNLPFKTSESEHGLIISWHVDMAPWRFGNTQQWALWNALQMNVPILSSKWAATKSYNLQVHEGTWFWCLPLL